MHVNRTHTHTISRFSARPKCNAYEYVCNIERTLIIKTSHLYDINVRNEIPFFTLAQIGIKTALKEKTARERSGMLTHECVAMVQKPMKCVFQCNFFIFWRIRKKKYWTASHFAWELNYIPKRNACNSIRNAQIEFWLSCSCVCFLLPSQYVNCLFTLNTINNNHLLVVLPVGCRLHGAFSMIARSAVHMCRCELLHQTTDKMYIYVVVLKNISIDLLKSCWEQSIATLFPSLTLSHSVLRLHFVVSFRVASIFVLNVENS